MRVVPSTYLSRCCNLDSVLSNLVDSFHQRSAHLWIKQFDKADWLIKGGLCKLRDIFHISVMFDVMDDLFYKGNLILI